jgi:hypothetical protein
MSYLLLLIVDGHELFAAGIAVAIARPNNFSGAQDCPYRVCVAGIVTIAIGLIVAIRSFFENA